MFLSGPPSLTDGETEAGTLLGSQRLQEAGRNLGLWYLTSVLFCGVLVTPLPEEQLMACSAFSFSFSGPGGEGEGEDGVAQLCSWKVHPVETGTFLSFYYGQPWRRTASRE